MRSSRSLRHQCILLVLILFISAGCKRSPEARSAAFIEAGKRLLQNRDPARAALQFRNAVQATPGSAEAHYQLSLAYIAANDPIRGVAGLRRALDLNPKHTGAQLKLSQ